VRLLYTNIYTTCKEAFNKNIQTENKLEKPEVAKSVSSLQTFLSLTAG
jgi:hypothetical protein